MKFEKMRAEVVLNLKDGSKESYIEEKYNLRVTNLVSNLQYSINEDKSIHLNGEYICSGNLVKSFEILNYEELLEYEQSLPKEEN